MNSTLLIQDDDKTQALAGLTDFGTVSRIELQERIKKSPEGSMWIEVLYPVSEEDTHAQTGWSAVT